MLVGKRQIDARPEGEEIVRCLGRRARGPNDRAIVFPQNIKPGADIVGVADGRDDAERRAAECRRHFGAELLARI